MGGGVSADKLRGTEQEIINLMMPLYYVPLATISVREINFCKSGWSMILNNTSPEFHRLKGSPNFPYDDCITWFYKTFYDRLFDIHPLCKPLFTNGIESIGKFLVQMMSMSLNQLEDKPKFKKMMIDLAGRHCERGVKGVEYGIVGDVLFYALQTTLGPLIYSADVDSCWKLLFSTMLREIVPLCIEYERKGLLKRSTVRDTSDESRTKQPEAKDVAVMPPVAEQAAGELPLNGSK